MGRRTQRTDLEAVLDNADALRAMARGLVRDAGDADDLVQEAALHALHREGPPPRSPGAYWRGVVKNLARHEDRAAGRRRVREHKGARGEAVGGTADAIARLETHRIVLDAVRQLPPASREAIVLRYYEGLSPRVIAKRLDTPVATVKARLKRGLSTLRSELDRRHGGDRGLWLAALVPVGWSKAWTTGSLLRVVGGIVERDTRRHLVLGLLGLLAAGGVAWTVIAREGAAPDAEPAAHARAADDAASRPDRPGDAPALAGRGAPDAPIADEVDDAPTTSSAGGTAPQADDPEETFEATPVDMEAFALAPPAQVANPVAPPPLPPGVRPRLGPAGGSGPTGHWSRFSMLPDRRGEATLEVRVTDAAGSPLEGAVVYLAPPATLEQDARSFGDLRTLGTTDARGRIRAEALPAGAAAVCANIHGRLNTRGGLDVRHARPTLLADGRTARVVLALPLSRSDFGTVTGRVVDEKGRAIASAAVATAMRREWSDREGAFRFEGLPSGENTLRVQATGSSLVEHEVVVPPGGTMDVTITLTAADVGSLRLEGVAQLPDGTRVANAYVYLMEDDARGTLRRTFTDGEGRFVLEDLPDRLEHRRVTVQVSGFPRYRTGALHLEGLHDPQVVVEVPGAFGQVVLTLLDDSTGDPIRIADVDFEGEGEGGRRGATLTFDRESERWMGFVEADRGRLVVETLTHGSWSRTLDLPPAGGETAIEVRLTRVAEDPVEVALQVTLRDAATRLPIPKARLDVFDADSGERLSGFEGERPGGVYRMGAPSGRRRLVVTAPGYAAHETHVDLTPEQAEHPIEVALSAE